MGTFTKKLLAEWNLSNLQDDFQRHCIGEIIMPFLDKETIKGLIPQLGIRVDFMLKWNERYGKNDCLTNQANDMDHKSNENSHDLDSTMYSTIMRENSSSKDGDTKPCKLVILYAFMGDQVSDARKNYVKKSANTVVDIIISELLKDYDRMESHPRLVVNKKRLAFPTLPTHLHISYHPNPTPRLDPEYPHPNPPASMYILCNYLVNSSSLSIVISFEER
ncbi:hypothetical protein PV326_006495 [Microctonus aethiopoides]|nr:hypothetical protein PV326_006495 [Microctonus aethiopoides]